MCWCANPQKMVGYIHTAGGGFGLWQLSARGPFCFLHPPPDRNLVVVVLVACRCCCLICRTEQQYQITKFNILRPAVRFTRPGRGVGSGNGHVCIQWKETPCDFTVRERGARFILKNYRKGVPAVVSLGKIRGHNNSPLNGKVPVYFASFCSNNNVTNDENKNEQPFSIRFCHCLIR